MPRSATAPPDGSGIRDSRNAPSASGSSGGGQSAAMAADAAADSCGKGDAYSVASSCAEAEARRQAKSSRMVADPSGVEGGQPIPTRPSANTAMLPRNPRTSEATGASGAASAFRIIDSRNLTAFLLPVLWSERVSPYMIVRESERRETR